MLQNKSFTLQNCIQNFGYESEIQALYKTITFT